MNTISNSAKGAVGMFVIAAIMLGSAGTAEAGFLKFLDKAKGSAQAGNSRAESSAAEQCNAPVYARVVFTKNPNANFGVRNWGLGNLERKIFVGGSATADVYQSGEWFKISDGRTAIIDRPIDGYEDVKGLAVQRGDGWVRLVLHGSWEEPEGAILTNRERAEGAISFSTDRKTYSTMIVPVSVVNDEENKLETVGSSNTNHPQNDKISLRNGNRSHFKFVVTSNDDGYYTNYANVRADCKK